ncbi:MAG: sigma-54 interaction domain-containing protein [Planctomycetota bacterium]
MTAHEISKDTLLDIWKEVGRHEGLEEFLVRLLQLLPADVRPERVHVRRVEPALKRLEAIASVPPGSLPGNIGRWTQLTPEGWLRVADWIGAGKIAAWKSGARDPMRELLEQDDALTPLVAGPLLARGTPIGVALFHGPDATLLEHVREIEALLEPIAVALSNDLRLQELARLREAAEADNRALLTRLQRDDISASVVGERTGLRLVMERVEQVARTDAPVLILGETGSGKEVVARAIHARSTRSSGPFLRINCGAIPPELVDSELFGHERGSFTGAVNTRRGWFERADGGTLFLDELGELPPAAQVRLLRVLQDGSFERVGGHQSLHVDVRIVAATHRDMQELVGEGRFRQDLWYRIHVFPIRLPPLRERADDIAPLAAHFAARAGRRLFGVELRPSESDVEILRAYPWPGNVRELASVIERAAILGDGRLLEISAALGGDRSRVSARGDAPAAAAPSGEDLTSLEGAMADHIRSALKRARGRIEGARGAADLLGINPHTLRSRMRKLGIDWARYREGAVDGG